MGLACLGNGVNICLAKFNRWLFSLNCSLRAAPLENMSRLVMSCNTQIIDRKRLIARLLGASMISLVEI